MTARVRLARPVVPVVRLSSSAQTWLWWVAIVMMFVDHGFMAFAAGTPSAEVARAVTRVAWPIFGFLPAYNVVIRGVQPSRYYVPMLVLLLASQLPFTLLFGWRVSIFGTLLLGILLLDVWRGSRSRWWLLMLPLGLLVDYGLPGVVLPLLFALLLERRSWSVVVAVVITVLLNNWRQPAYAPVALLAPALLPVVRRLPEIGRLPKWARYLIYPGHLAVIAVLMYL